VVEVALPLALLELSTLVVVEVEVLEKAPVILRQATAVLE